MTATVATSGLNQRSYSAPPETGTLTTVQPPAWLTATAYKLDHTAGGINRVVNAGNLYQCRVDHTSSAPTAPTTTSDTTQWAYLGAAPATNNTVSGSVIVAIHAGAMNGSGSTLHAVSDNDSGAYTSVDVFSYADFAQWGMGVYRRSTAAGTKSGFTASANWAGTSVGSGAGEEQTLAWLELRNVLAGAPHAHSHVERAAPTGGTVTAANITTTVPCLVVSVWGGIGNVVTPGTSHAATPGGGLTLVPSASAKMSISNNGYIQMAVAWRVVMTPATFAEVWTTTEGAQLFTAAWPLSEVGGTGAVTLGAVTSSAAGKVAIAGAGAVTLGAVTLTAAGTVAAAPISGALAVTLGAVTDAAAGQVAVRGSGGVTLGAATAAGVGAVAVQGAAAPTTGAVTSAAAGVVPVTGSGSGTLDAVTVAATGGTGVTGAAAIALGAASGVAAGKVAVQGAGANTIGSATVSAAAVIGTVGGASIGLDAATVAATGVVPVVGAGSATIGEATLAATGSAGVQGSAAVALGAVTGSAAGKVAVSGTGAVTLGAITAAAAAVVGTVGTADVTLGAVTDSAAGRVAVTGQGAQQLGAVTEVGAGQVAVTGAAAEVLGPAVGAGAGVVEGAPGGPVTGELAATLGAVTAAADGDVAIAGAADIQLGAVTLVANNLGGGAHGKINASVTVGNAVGGVRIG